ncbi:MAG: hypothetical protein NC223_08920 [Butyrivibrio sp.]|nr:hypothetical protein [Butyrivibrio sp.]
MKIKCVWEHNGGDTLLYSDNITGAFARGESKEAAMDKMAAEIISFTRWSGSAVTDITGIEIVQEKASSLEIRDADSDVIFDSEKKALTRSGYDALKTAALKSAADFLRLYEAVPDKSQSLFPKRNTFYGCVPRTAEEIYLHTKNVNSYYWGEIRINADNGGTILDCRKRGFDLLERRNDFLSLGVFIGSYDEEWSLPKVLRRFIWHDRIHAKAMYRRALTVFGKNSVPDIFRFEG